GPGLRQDGLVDEVVADDARLVGVADRNLTPDLDGPILVRFGLGPEPRHPVTIAYVARILRAGRRMHVQDDVQAVGAAPSEKRIEELEALLANFLAFRIPEVEIVEWQPDVVVAPVGDGSDVLLGDKVRPVEFEKRIGVLLSDQVFDLRANRARRAAVR